MSTNEVEFSRTHQANNYLYRMYAYDEDHNSRGFYTVSGSVEKAFDLKPTQYWVVRS
jgi:hypothetical protein